MARKLNVCDGARGQRPQGGPAAFASPRSSCRRRRDSHLWSQTYDRELDDIFAVQDDIARSVVQELRSALLGEQADAAASARVREQVRAATRGRTLNAQAHELYLLGRFLVDRMNPDDTTTAIGYYRQALQLDPRYALAWAGLAGAYSNQADYSWAPMAQTFELARAAALHAVELEPELAEGHTELAWVQMCHEWDWHGAAASSARALELGASDRSAVIAASVLADSLGRKEESVALARRAAALDPLSYIAHGNLALRCLNSGLAGGSRHRAGSGLQAQSACRSAASPYSARCDWNRGGWTRPSQPFSSEGIEALRLSGIAMAQHAPWAARRIRSDAEASDRPVCQRRCPAGCRSLCLLRRRRSRLRVAGARLPATRLRTAADAIVAAAAQPARRSALAALFSRRWDLSKPRASA